ncbi:MAG: hypothetical protein CMG05_03425 [Candidatus Marinimicrobia bacterium]|nr:hypothetical protein [Candidatus Neomarinimicrobiota bacterium]|tara:strand:+ start:760 stop:1185 length:426 start_codon:yes stop_codon:yes gene_type:complete
MEEKNTVLLKKVLQSEGLRYTKQRQAIWNEINGSKEHRNVDEIYFSIIKSGIKVSRATVYRTIDVLVKNSLVKKIDGLDSGSLYENRLDRKHHDHMICVETGKIIEFYNKELENLQDQIAEEKGYKIVRHVHQLFVKPIES